MPGRVRSQPHIERLRRHRRMPQRRSRLQPRKRGLPKRRRWLSVRASRLWRFVNRSSKMSYGWVVSDDSSLRKGVFVMVLKQEDNSHSMDQIILNYRLHKNDNKFVLPQNTTRFQHMLNPNKTFCGGWQGMHPLEHLFGFRLPVLLGELHRRGRVQRGRAQLHNGWGLPQYWRELQMRESDQWRHCTTPGLPYRISGKILKENLCKRLWIITLLLGIKLNKTFNISIRMELVTVSRVFLNPKHVLFQCSRERLPSHFNEVPGMIQMRF